MTELVKLITDSMENLKAMDIQVFDVSSITSIADHMVIASGRSDRQVRAIAEKTVETLKQHGHKPLGVEGLDQAEWILIDFGDVIVHIMHPATRAYYQLEKLWSVDARSE